MIKGVIFDLDGLMVDTEVISYKCYKDVLKKYGIDFPLEEYKKDCPGKQLVTNLAAIRDQYHLDYDIEEEKAFIGVQEKNYMINDGVALKDGLKELLSFLKDHDYKIALATSSTKARAHMIMKDHDIEKYFDEYVYGDEVKNGKPAPDVFLKACEKLEIKEDEGLVLEDSENGIEAAHRAGIDVICVPDMKIPGDEYKAKCLHVYHSLSDVIEYLKSFQ